MTVRVVRGRAATPDADRDATRQLLDRVGETRSVSESSSGEGTEPRDGETGDPVVRAWTPHRQLAFGRRDANAEGYGAARRAAETRGFPPVERNVGGRAVAYTGTTLAFAAIEPVDDARAGIQTRYDDAVTTTVAALESVGVDAEPGEPADSFCPGDHSVQAGCGGRSGKLAGIAQRVTADAALVAGCILVDGAEELREVLAPVYDALDVPFDPRSLGTVAEAGGPADPEPVARALETAFVGSRESVVERLGD